MINHLLRFFTVIALAFTITACSSLKESAEKAFQKPEIVGQSFRINNINFEKVGLTADIDIANPGQIPLYLLPSEYQVFINDKSLLSGLSGKAELKPGQVGQVSLPIELSFSDLSEMLRSFDNREELTIRLDTGLKLQGPLNLTWSETLSLEKTLPIPELPEIGVPQVSVEKMDFSGFRVMIRLPVTNPNTFALTLNQLNSLVRIDQLESFSINLDQETSMPAESETVLNIPVELTWSKAARTLIPLLESGQQPEMSFEGEWVLEADIPGFGRQQGTFEL